MAQDRREAVLLLGRSLLDYLPQPRQSSQLLETMPGLSASREVPCGVCKGRGRMVAPSRPCVLCPPRTGPSAPPPAFGAKHGCEPCLGCEGTGWRRRRAGDPEFDSYAGAEIGSEEGKADQKPWERLQDLERQLAHTERLLALWEAPESVEVGWEAQRQRMWRTGDYARLVAVLDHLRHLAPGRFTLFWKAVVVQEDVKLTGRAAVELLRTVDALAKAMGPRRIRVPRHLEPQRKNAQRKTSLWRGQTPAHAAARAERDEEIRARREAGWGVERLAAHYHLTPKRIKQIVKGAP